MISLLYIDSDEMLRQAFKHSFEQDPEIIVITLPSAYEALDLIRTQKFDVIISEYILPVTDGQTFLETLRRTRNERIPFIFFAKKEESSVVIQALNAGATSYVLKGNDPESEFGVLKHFVHMAVRQYRIESELKESERRYGVLWKTSQNSSCDSSLTEP